MHGLVLVGIGKTDAIVIADIGLIGIGGHLLDFWLNGAKIQKSHHFKHRGGGTIPVAWSFVTTTILGIGIDESLCGFPYLGDGLGLTRLIFLTDKDTGEPVGTDPGVPVHASRLPPVVIFNGRLEDAPLYLAVDTLTEVWREGVELFLEHVSRPHNQTGSLSIEEIHLL